MNAIHRGLRITSLFLLTLTLASGDSFAQRGEGGRGGRGGGGQSGNRGSFSQGQSENRGGQSGNRAGFRNGNQGRQFSGRGESRSFNRGSIDRAQPQREREGRRTQPEIGDSARERQSFYRGDESDRPRTQSFEREGANRRGDREDFRRSDLDRDSNARRMLNGRTGRFDDRFDFERYRWDGRDGNWDRSANRIRGQWRDWDRGSQAFRVGWWDNYGGQWPAYSPWLNTRWNNQPYYWWGWTPANRLTNWLVFSWNRPYYWGYGPGRNIYYRDNYVYYDGRQVMPAEEYYDYVHGLAQDVEIDAQAAEQMEWKPLGVFAAKREDESESQRLIQLAINQDGVLSGTYYNREADKMYPLEGKVDDRTQRATWHFVDGEHDAIVFETSLYNLTKDETTMMVHFGPDSEDAQVWDLIRLEQSTATATNESGATGRRLP